MIYTVSWVPSITFLGVLMIFLVVPVIAMAAVLAAVLFALVIVLAAAAAMAWSPVLAVRAARRRWPQLGRGGEPAVEPRPAPAPLVNPQLHRAR